LSQETALPAETTVQDITIRPAEMADMATVVRLDEMDTGLAKPDYWRDVFTRYVTMDRADRFVLVAQKDARVIGFIVGEVRAWEFGSPPCGWVFAINVDPAYREKGIGSLLLDDISRRFKAAGVDTLRTMHARRDTLNLAFFRSQGLTAGSYVQLEKKLD
jgi:ribosomal protein S18 acetylase RimI-like enzyme